MTLEFAHAHASVSVREATSFGTAFIRAENGSSRNGEHLQRVQAMPARGFRCVRGERGLSVGGEEPDTQSVPRMSNTRRMNGDVEPFEVKLCTSGIWTFISVNR